MPPRLNPHEITILNTDSLSDALDLRGGILQGILMPAVWTAANITFEEESTFDAYDAAGTELTAIAAASRYIALDPIDFAGFRSIYLRSGTTGVPVNQVAEAEIILLIRKLS